MLRWIGLILLLPVVVFAIEENQDSTPASKMAENLPKERSIDFFAWGDVLWRDSDRDDQEGFLDLGQAYAGLDARLNKWRFVLELEFEHEPDYGEEEGDREFEIDRAFIAYDHSAALRFRLGKVNTPAGIWKPLHWSITVDTISRPIMEDNGYIPIKSEGLEILGTRVFSFGEMEYTFIAAHVDEEIANEASLDDARAFGGDIKYRHRERYTLGFSLYSYSGLESEDFTVTGWQPYVDLELIDNRLLLRGEALLLERTAEDSVRSFYTKLKYRITPRHYLNARYDQGEDERRAEGARRRATTVTVGWWPKEQWRIKAEYTSSRLPGDAGPDYREWSLWTGYIFR